MNFKWQKVLQAFAWVVLAIVYYMFLYNRFLMCEFNSDSANFVLEGYDIKQGNFLLSDWNLTGISFIATDLVLYIVAAFFAGISQESAAIAASLSVFLLTIVSFLLINDKKRNSRSIWGYLLFIAIAAFPCQFLMESVRYHSVCIVESLFALYLLNKYDQKNSLRENICYVAIAVLLLSLSAQSDALSILSIIGAIIIASLWKLIFDYVKYGNFEKKYMIHFGVAMGSIVLSFIGDKLFYQIGGANKNGFLEGNSFILIDELMDKVNMYILLVLRLFNADFLGKKLFAIETPFYFIRVVFILITMFFIVYNIVQWMKQKTDDYIVVVLSIGVTLVSVICIITTIMMDAGGGRYMGTFPALFSVIFVRSVQNLKIDWEKVHGLLLGKVMAVVLVLVLAASTVVPLPTGEIYHLNKQEALVSVLEENGLSNGYASFWNASASTVISNNRVTVRATLGHSGTLKMYNWFCKNSWYEEPANFVVVEDGDTYGMTYENMILALGEPSEVIEVDSLQILKYDYNITTKFSNGLSDGVLYGFEWIGSENSRIENGVRIIDIGGMLWGPYSFLEEGEYKINCHGVNIENAEIDVYSSSLGLLMEAEKINEDNSFSFILEQDVPDLEIRVYNNTNDFIEVNSFVVEKNDTN